MVFSAELVIAKLGARARSCGWLVLVSPLIHRGRSLFELLWSFWVREKMWPDWLVFLKLGHDLADGGVESSNHGGLVALRTRPLLPAIREVCGDFHSIAGLLSKLVVRVRGGVGKVKEERGIILIPLGLVNPDCVEGSFCQ